MGTGQVITNGGGHGNAAAAAAALVLVVIAVVFVIDRVFFFLGRSIAYSCYQLAYCVYIV